MQFNNVEIRTKVVDGKTFYNRVDAGLAIGYRNPHMLGRNCFGSQQYITKSQLINVLWRSTYPTATYLADALTKETLPTAGHTEETHNMAKVRSDFLNLKHLAMEGYGKTEEEAIAAAHNYLRNELGVEILDKFIKAETASLSPAEIGNEVKIPEEKVNVILSKLNYQVPVNGHFVPTLKGKAFAVLQNHNIIFWHPEVMAEIREII